MKKCADCGCSDQKIVFYDRGETQYGKFKIGLPLCYDCYLKTCRNFDEDFENNKPYSMFEKV